MDVLTEQDEDQIEYCKQIFTTVLLHNMGSWPRSLEYHHYSLLQEEKFGFPHCW